MLQGTVGIAQLCADHAHAGQACQCGNTAGGIALQDEAAGRFCAKLEAGVVEPIPAPRRPWIVAADERQILTALPDGRYELKSFATDEARNNVAAYAVFHGTHTGPGGPVLPHEEPA